MLIKHLVITLIILLSCQNAAGQDIGLINKIGIAYANEEKISRNLDYEMNLSIPVMRKLNFIIGTEFMYKRTYWNKYIEKYRETVYSASDAQLFYTNSIEIGLSFFVNPHIYISTAFAAEFIKLKRIIYNPEIPFYINWINDQVEQNVIENKNKRLLRPGISFGGGYLFPINSKYSVASEIFYKTVFIPNDLLIEKHSLFRTFVLRISLIAVIR